MTTTIARRAVAAAVAATAIVLTPLAASAADEDDKLRLDHGHIDAFNLALNEDDSISLNLKEDVTGSHVQHAPETVELFVKDEAYLEGLPPAYLPPGAPTSLWYLPLTQDSDLIWPGWDNQAVAPVYGSNSTTDIEILSVDGPGDVFLWSNGTFGDVRQLMVNGYQLPDTIRMNFTAHVHSNWGFTAEGTYTLDVQATVTNADGTRTSTSEVETYTFIVGQESEEEPADVELAISGVGHHYHTGDMATLKAVESPQVSDSYQWFTRSSADAEWVAVEGATGDTYGFVVTEPHEVRVVAYDAADAVLAESAPVDIAIDDHGNSPVVGPEIETELPVTEGALVVSIAADARKAVLSDLTLNSEADRYVSEGAITGITVTDTRQDNPGWNANGRVRSLASVDGDRIAGSYVGWTPEVVSFSGAGVTAGPAVLPGLDSGSGISGWSALGSAPEGASVGTSVLGADIRIEAPVTTVPGTYSGVVLITVI